MISGTTVSVELRERNSRDGFGHDVEAYSAPQDVGNVLVVPGACAELDSTRPEGVRVAYTLHFPKGWAGDLRGARVTLPAPFNGMGKCRVVGSPAPYMDANCPTPWHMAVEVEAIDG